MALASLGAAAFAGSLLGRIGGMDALAMSFDAARAAFTRGGR